MTQVSEPRGYPESGQQVFVELDPQDVEGVAVVGVDPGSLSCVHLGQLEEYRST
jgi:hypothetical protein